MHNVAQIQVLHQCRDVCRVVVHVVAVGHLRRPAVTAPIVHDDAIALPNEDQGLAIPFVTAEGPAWWSTIGWPLFGPQSL